MNGKSRSGWQTAAIAMAAIIAGMQAINAWRSFADPAGFAAYFGVPLADPRDSGLVMAYGLRAAFTAILVAALLALRQWTALLCMAIAALVMPVGDAWLTNSADAPTSIVGRHIAIAVYLVLTAYVVGQAIRDR